MRIINFILCLSIVVFQGSYASAKGKSKSKSKSSKMLRAEKKFGVSGRYGNIAGGIYGYGLEASYNKNSKIQFSLNIQSGSTDLKKKIDDSDPIVHTDKFDVNCRQSYIMTRYFFDNSFHVGAGLGHRVFEGTLTLSTKSQFLDSTTMSQKIKTESYAAYLTIGNTWTYDNGFFFGLDWLGAAHPLSSNSTVTTTVSTSGSIFTIDNELNANIHEIGEKAGKNLGKLTTYQFLVFNMGFMF